MVLPNQTIESFFPKIPSASQAAAGGSTVQKPGDGIAPSDAGAGVQPETQVWHPNWGPYEEVNISDLQPGPCKITFKGRIVNSSPSLETNPGSKKAMLSKGYHFLVLKDDTGLVAIKLLVTGTDHLRLQLGRLVTIWANRVFVYPAATTTVLIPNVPLLIPIHPSLTSPSSIKFHPLPTTPSLFRAILPSSSPLTQLLPLLTSQSHPDASTRLLVLVDSILPPRTIKSKTPPNLDLHLTEVRVFDETAACPLKLWGDKASSARAWVPNKTVLLITGARRGTGELVLGLGTLVEVDPVGEEADWLRGMAERKAAGREVVCVPFPEGGFPDQEAGGLCTLAEMDERVREKNTGFVARINVLVLGTKLGEMKRLGKLCCAECCNTPLYASTPTTLCKTCSTTRPLILNPAALGRFTDETGCLSGAMMVWSDRACTELLYGSKSHLPDANGVREDWRSACVGMDADALKEGVDEKLAYCRVTLLVGWQGEGGVGRVCVLGVEWDEVVEGE